MCRGLLLDRVRLVCEQPAGGRGRQFAFPFFVKFAALVAVPPGVVTLMGPVLTPVPTTTTSCVFEDEVTDLTGVLLAPNVMLVKPVKFVPLIVTVVPELPLVGVKLVIVGTGGGGVT